MDTKLLKSTIRESIKVKEEQAVRSTLIKYAPNSTTALDYVCFTKELLEEQKWQEIKFGVDDNLFERTIQNTQ